MSTIIQVPVLYLYWLRSVYFTSTSLEPTSSILLIVVGTLGEHYEILHSSVAVFSLNL